MTRGTYMYSCREPCMHHARPPAGNTTYNHVTIGLKFGTICGLPERGPTGVQLVAVSTATRRFVSCDGGQRAAFKLQSLGMLRRVESGRRQLWRCSWKPVPRAHEMRIRSPNVRTLRAKRRGQTGRYLTCSTSRSGTYANMYVITVPNRRYVCRYLMQ